MSKYVLYTLAILSLILLLSGCSGRPSELKASPGQEFSLSIGQSALITGENIQIKFEEIVEDSRCPKDVTCVWAGRVSCIVRLTDGESSDEMVLTEPGLTDQYS